MTIKETYVKKIKEVEELESRIIICNKCGDSEEGYYVGCQSVTFDFGYGSYFDGEQWELELCDSCIKELAKSLKLVPKGFNQSFGSEEYSQKEFDKWKVSN